MESFIRDLVERIDRADDRLERAIYPHREGWEDDDTDVISELQTFLREMQEYVEWLTDEKWVDLSDTEIEAMP